MKSIAQLIAEELNVRVAQVDAAIALLDDKATVPFIARYRKEATGGLDDTQLRALEERLTYLRDLEERRDGDPEEHRGTGQADAGARGADPRRGDQGAPRGSLPPLQGEAAHQGADRARSRPRAARAGAAGRTRRCARRRPPRPMSTPTRAWPTSAAALEGARWILMETLRRRRRAGRRPAHAAVGARRVDVDGRARQGSRGRQILRLLRRQGTSEGGAVASHAGAAARTQGRRSCACRWRCPTKACDGPTEPERRIAGRADIENKGRPPTSGSPKPCAGPGRSSCWATSSSTPSSACASRPSSKPSRCSAATCTTCCWPHRPDSA